MEQVFGTWRKANITWFSNAAKIGKEVVSLAYCGYGKGVAFAYNYDASLFHILVIRDVFYNDLQCEDEKWCFNIKCPLNKADLKYFAKYGIKSFEEIKKVHMVFEKISDKLEFADKGPIVIHFDKPILKVTVGKHG